MYGVYNIHPETLNITVRSLHKTYKQASEALRDQVNEYITIYKAYRTVIYINDVSEVDNHPETRYFVQVSDKYNNRIIIWERKKHVDRGYRWNSTSQDVQQIMTFSIMDLGHLMDLNESNESVVVDDMDLVKSLKKRQEQSSMAHGNHVNVIEELKDFLHRHIKVQGEEEEEEPVDN